MRKKHYFYIIAALSAGLWLSCEQGFDDTFGERPDTSDARPALTLAEARAYFESCGSGTRSGAGTEEFDYFAPGEFTPLWHEGVASEESTLASVDVPIAGERSFYVVYGADTMLYGYRLWHGVVVVKERTAEERMDRYLLFYIPDSTCVSAFPASRCAEFLNGELKTGFSGRAVYTTPEGFPVAAVRYSDGEHTAEAFLGDTTRGWEQNLEGLYDIIGGIRLMCLNEAETRVGYLKPDINPEEPFGLQYIGEVVVWPPYMPSPLKPNMGGGSGTVQPYVTNVTGSGGGGSTSGAVVVPPDYKKLNPNIKVTGNDPELIKTLNSLLPDCMGKKLISLLKDETTIEFKPNLGDLGQLKMSYYPDLDKRKATITVRDKSVYVLLEELIHAYQERGFNREGQYDSHKLNLEVESKLGWMMYLERTGQEILLCENLHFFGDTDGNRAFFELFDLYSRGVPSSDPGFKDAYRKAGEGLRDAGYPESKYKFDENKISVDNLKRLMSDCK